MAIILKLYANSKEDERIYSSLQKRIGESKIDTRDILFLRQIIPQKEKPYFSVKINDNEIYNNQNPRTFSVENSDGEISLLLEFLRKIKERK